MIESLFAIFSPNIYFHGIKHKTNKYGYLSEMEYEINDLLSIVIFVRVYVIFRCLINLSKYYNARANRVA